MPFINGRYHVNPTMGAALEAAREAEIRRGSPSRESNATGGPLSRAPEDFDYDSDDVQRHPPDEPAPVHRVEIEPSEILPSHSGRATSGFIARIHRSQPQSSANSSSSRVLATKPETHVFSNHGDLLNFLHDELSKA